MTPREEAPVTVTPEDVALFSELSDGRKNASTKLEAIARHRTQSAAAAKAREDGLLHALDLAKREIESLGALPEDIERALQRINLAAFPPAALSASDGEAGHA